MLFKKANEWVLAREQREELQRLGALSKEIRNNDNNFRAIEAFHEGVCNLADYAISETMEESMEVGAFDDLVNDYIHFELIYLINMVDYLKIIG